METKGLNRVRPVIKAFLLLAGIGLVMGAGALLYIGSQGISAKAEPGRFETMMARTMRHLAVPSGDRNRKNPVPLTQDVAAAGMAHWADHCAACHGNDGSGETEIGVGMYPKPPDMRLPATQSLTDGELFYIIENGIRLTGMPAWGDGTAETAEGSWHLGAFHPKTSGAHAGRDRADGGAESAQSRGCRRGRGGAQVPGRRRRSAHAHARADAGPRGT